MRIFSFDVESLGLYGPAFAVGWSVVDRSGEIESGYSACDPSIYVQGIEDTLRCLPVDPFIGDELKGTKTSSTDLEWVRQHVFPHLPEPTEGSLFGVRSTFWQAVSRFRRENSGMRHVVLSDTGFPVETGFLHRVFLDDHNRCQPGSPFPYVDAMGLFVLSPVSLQRQANELPAHHPTNDARFSARKYLQALKQLGVDR